MTAKEIIDIIESRTPLEGKTCDTFKAGNPDKQVGKVAVSMFASVDTVKKAKEWGADMLVVHEPTYYQHYDEDIGSRIAERKKKIIEESGIVIYRYHDHPHAMSRESDMITDGEIRALGLHGKLERLPDAATFRLISDEPLTARGLAEKMKNDLGLSFVRVAGKTDQPSRNLALCFGTPPGLDKIIEDESLEIIMTGEINEWGLAERVRDVAAMGMNKSLIVMTHVGSERDGMKLFTERFFELFPDIEVKYIECGEVYQTL